MQYLFFLVLFKNTRYSLCYTVSLLIAQNSKPFSEFVKNCIIEAVKAFDNSLTLEEVINIILSARIIIKNY